jgi:hypothetical protein
MGKRHKERKKERNKKKKGKVEEVKQKLLPSSGSV